MTAAGADLSRFKGLLDLKSSLGENLLSAETFKALLALGGARYSFSTFKVVLAYGGARLYLSRDVF